MAIGFELKATGTNGFRHSSGAWTEGSMVALKLAMSTPKINVPGSGGYNRGMIGSIEASFSKIAKNLLSSICSMGANFTLFLKGDITLKYVFESAKGGSQTESEFLQMLSGATDGGIGDQVMIHLCKTIEAFIIMNLTSNDKLILNVDIDL